MSRLNRNRAITAFIATYIMVVAVACASTPHGLSLSGASAFHRMQVQTDLNLVRDTAVAASKTDPPLISKATLVKVATFHRSAVITMHAASNGWQASVQTGLDELLRDLPPDEKNLLTPYVLMVKAVLAGVS